MKKLGLFLIAFFMLNLSFATAFDANYEIADTSKPKQLRIEKKIINGTETTQIWVNGQELKEGTAEYKKYLKEVDSEGIGTKMGKRKIIIQEIDDVDMEFSTVDPNDIETINIEKTENGKKIIIKKKDGTIIEKSADNPTTERNIDVEVESTENGEHIIVKEDGKVIEDIIVEKNGKQKVKIITENEETEVIIIKDKNGKTKKRKRKSKAKNKGKNKEVRVIVKEVETEEVEEIIIDNQ